MNMKFLIIGVVLIAAVTFGFWFWDQLVYNQNELAQTPLSENQGGTDQAVKSEDSASLETELDSINVEGLDSEQLDLSGL